jgi:hypothetical protein
MTDLEDGKPYRVEQKEGRFHVLDEDGNGVLVCDFAGNAQQYADLLTQAYRRGYKAGMRKLKCSESSRTSHI